ncbi:hypothetical protein AAHZ94_34505, partial [Streptomyces sp. HSW2009]
MTQKLRPTRRRPLVPSIDVVVAREILDSRGNPTVEVEVGLDDRPTRPAALPSRPTTRHVEGPSRRGRAKAPDRRNGVGKGGGV